MLSCCSSTRCGWTSDGSPVSLTANEIANLTAYLATGRRAVFIGENSSWSDWNAQILGLVGGSGPTTNASGPTSSIVVNELTAGVSQLNLLSDGTTPPSGLALFDQNFAQLWDDHAVTILSVNAMSTQWNQSDHARFFTNLANWLGTTIDDCTDSTDVSLNPALALDVNTCTNEGAGYYWVVRLYLSSGGSLDIVQTPLPENFGGNFPTAYIPTNPPVAAVCSFLINDRASGELIYDCESPSGD